MYHGHFLSTSLKENILWKRKKNHHSFIAYFFYLDMLENTRQHAFLSKCPIKKVLTNFSKILRQT